MSYVAPAATVQTYAGFWPRFGATIVDTLIALMVTVPLMMMVKGSAAAGPMDFLVNWVAPAIYTIVFWSVKQATPGKMVLSMRIVDAHTGSAPSLGQYFGRYLGYFVSLIPLGLGFFWIAFDERGQGWHDKLARTVVVRPNAMQSNVATFDSNPG
jgi:uncharacterized RDD family membrane protein YckC